MTISVNWATKIITVQQVDLTLVSAGLYTLDVNAFRLALKNLEDDLDGMVFADTHVHNTEVTISGVTLARVFRIINGYTVTFQDTGTPYSVRCVGANHNIGDVKNVNQVSLIISNSAGLIATVSGSGVTVQDRTDIAAAVRVNLSTELARVDVGVSTRLSTVGYAQAPTAAANAAAVWAKAVEGLSAEEMLRVMLAALAGKRSGIGTATEQYMGRDGVTPRITMTPTDAAGNGTPNINGTP